MRPVLRNTIKGTTSIVADYLVDTTKAQFEFADDRKS
jgi:hypothetical protein